MNRDRWLLLISAVIFLSVGIYYWRSGWFSRLTTKKGTNAPTQSMTSSGDKIEATGQGQGDSQTAGGTSSDEGDWGRNPFLTLAETNRKEKPVESGLKIKAIVIGSPKSMATLDGQTVTVGEKIGEETVVAIHSHAVVLEKDGHRRTLKIEDPPISIEVKEKKR